MTKENKELYTFELRDEENTQSTFWENTTKSRFAKNLKEYLENNIITDEKTHAFDSQEIKEMMETHKVYQYEIDHDGDTIWKYEIDCEDANEFIETYLK